MTSIVHQKNGTDINNSISSSTLNSNSNMIFYKSEFHEQSENNALPIQPLKNNINHSYDSEPIQGRSFKVLQQITEPKGDYTKLIIIYDFILDM